jgi:hypothetical protein
MKVLYKGDIIELDTKNSIGSGGEADIIKEDKFSKAELQTFAKRFSSY